MRTIKSGRDFTGYLIFRSRKTGAVVREWVGPYFFQGYAEDGRSPFIARRVPCPTGGSWDIHQGEPVYGRFVTEVVCGSKCMGAIGPTCDCSCGGKNHGGRFTAAA